MNIIFGKLPELDEKYTVLELDTIRIGPQGPEHTAYCVVENIPITELSRTASLKELHSNLIENYAKKNWSYCEQAIEHLMGKWGGEVDSFYEDIRSRVNRLKTLTLDDGWTPVISKT